MPSLDEAAAVGLVGGDVLDLEAARDVVEATPHDVAEAEKAADFAELKAQASERQALEGTLPGNAGERGPGQRQIRAAESRHCPPEA